MEKHVGRYWDVFYSRGNNVNGQMVTGEVSKLALSRYCTRRCASHHAPVRNVLGRPEVGDSRSSEQTFGGDGKECEQGAAGQVGRDVRPLARRCNGVAAHS